MKQMRGSRLVVFLISQFTLGVPMITLPFLAFFAGRVVMPGGSGPVSSLSISGGGGVWAVIAIGLAFSISRCGQELVKPIATLGYMRRLGMRGFYMMVTLTQGHPVWVLRVTPGRPAVTPYALT